MSTEFSNIKNVNSSSDKDYVRAVAVEAALVLLNTRLLNQSSLSPIIDSNAVSIIADKIEEALKMDD